MKQAYLLLFTLLLLVSGQSLIAQSRNTTHTLKLDHPKNAPEANIQELNWMVGRWEGEGFGGTVEETWNPAIGGTMIGSFRLVTEKGPDFYELLVIMPEGESLAYKVKHFNPDLSGWEEKDDYVTFPLVRLNQDTAFFEGLTIIRDGDQLRHYLSFTSKEGAVQETSLNYTRRAQFATPTLKEVMDKFPQEKQTPVLMLGSYHMSNPGMDMFNLEADDVSTPKRQAEIQAVVDQLALWRPTKVAVESPYGDSITIARYQAYLRGELELRNSEEEQIGFRLARQLGHETVYPIDVRMMLDDEGISKLIGANPQKYGPYMQALQMTGETAMSLMGKWLSEGTIGSMLYKMNEEDLNDIGHGAYFQSLVPIVEGDDYAGADMVNTWYHRNLRIFSNLHKINDSPSDRIFIVYGAGHIPLLQRFVEDSPYFRMDNVLDYLRGL